MPQACHICDSIVAASGASVGDSPDGFVCHDCGGVTCTDCKSIAVAKETNHCRQCRG